MIIGRLKHQIVIQTLTKSRGSSGSTKYAPVTYATVRAEILKNSSSEVYGGGQKDSNIQTKLFKVRYLSGVTSSMQIYYNSEYYDIEDVDNYKELNKYLVIRAVKRV